MFFLFISSNHYLNTELSHLQAIKNSFSYLNSSTYMEIMTFPPARAKFHMQYRLSYKYCKICSFILNNAIDATSLVGHWFTLQGITLWILMQYNERYRTKDSVSNTVFLDNSACLCVHVCVHVCVCACVPAWQYMSQKTSGSDKHLNCQALIWSVEC